MSVLIEKLEGSGIRSFTDFELIEAVVDAGMKSVSPDFLDSAVSLVGTSRELNKVEDQPLSPELLRIEAALELGRRQFGCRGQRVRSAQDAFPLLQHYADRPQEQFIVMTLNGAHEVIATRVVTVGLVNRTLFHPREVYADALQDRAVSIIVAHNHPSGQLEPSDEDREATRRMYEAGRILGITLLDHLILSPQGKYLSFVEAGIRFE